MRGSGGSTRRPRSLPLTPCSDPPRRRPGVPPGSGCLWGNRLAARAVFLGRAEDAASSPGPAAPVAWRAGGGRRGARGAAGRRGVL